MKFDVRGNIEDFDYYKKDFENYKDLDISKSMYLI